MSDYRPTRGRGSFSKGRSFGSNRNQPNDRAQSREDVSDETIGISNDSNEQVDQDGYDEESSQSDDETPVKRRGPNHGTPLPTSPSMRNPILILSTDSFDDPATSREITATLRGFLGGAYPTWTTVPKDYKDDMFNRFKARFKWHTHTEAEVRFVWERIAAARLRGGFCEARKKAKSHSRSDNPMDWRNHRPKWIGDTDWDACLTKWSNKKWQRVSRVNKSNRTSTAKGEHPKHRAGSVTFAVVEKRMKEENGGRSPTIFELFERTHMKPNGEFIDQKSKEIHEKYVKAFEEKYGGLDELDIPIIDLEIWTKVTNPP